MYSLSSSLETRVMRIKSKLVHFFANYVLYARVVRSGPRSKRKMSRVSSIIAILHSMSLSNDNLAESINVSYCPKSYKFSL